MKVIMTRYSISGMLEETGDDVNFIHIFFKIDDKPEYKMPYIVPYQDLLHFMLMELLNLVMHYQMLLLHQILRMR